MENGKHSSIPFFRQFFFFFFVFVREYLNSMCKNGRVIYARYGVIFLTHKPMFILTYSHSILYLVNILLSFCASRSRFCFVFFLFYFHYYLLLTGMFFVSFIWNFSTLMLSLSVHEQFAHVHVNCIYFWISSDSDRIDEAVGLDVVFEYASKDWR